MPRVLKHLIAVLVVLIVAGCGGGGCSSGCAGCGVTPLADGFDPQNRIENAASVRLTDSGLAFLQQNLGAIAGPLVGGGGSGVLTFPVPATSGSQLGIDYDICPGGPDANGNPPKCIAEIDIGNAQLSLTTAGPHNLHVTGPLPIRLQQLPIDIVYFFIPDSATLVLNGNGACPNDAQTFAQIPLNVDISIETDADMAHSRFGYSRVKIQSVSIDQNALESSINFCGGGFSNFVLNALKGIVVDMLISPLIDTLQTQIEDQLCQKANPALSPTCPTGTTDVDGVCRYSDQSCASMLLGTDGHVELGQLLASLSPGTKGALDFVLAAGGSSPRPDGQGVWGDLNPINSGASLGMYGGVEPTPVSKCVPFSDIPLPTAIPMPDELLENTVPNWPAGVDGPHVGLALSERFTNYALSGLYNSGLLCIGVSTESVALLNSGTIGLLASSMKDLGLQHEGQQIALIVRPQSPPQVTFGNGTDIATDPLIRVKMPNASFDFYIWSLDRFIRFMTATFDLDIPVNLTVTPDGLVPVIDTIGVENGKVTNSELLREDPQTLADSLGSLIGSQVGAAVGGGLAPIDLNSSLASLGLTLIIPETVEGQGSPGLRKLTKDTDNYLGIFASLGVATAVNSVPQSETSATLTGKTVDEAGLTFSTITKKNAPIAHLHVGSSLDDGTQAVEWQYRVDQGTWHSWTRNRFLDIQDDWLRIQGRHVISVRSRVVGQSMSIDRTPSQVEVVIDRTAPSVKLAQAEDGSVRLDVTDAVDQDATLVRTRIDGGNWSEWIPASDVADLAIGEGSEIEIEAKDGEGNVASTQQALIRGKAVPGAASGCGCSVPGGDQRGGKAGWLAGIALLGVFGRLVRRRKSPAPAAPEGEGSAPPKAAARRSRGARTALGAAALVAVSGAWSGCSCSDETTPVTAGSGTYDCKEPECISLTPGLIGAYTSVAVTGTTIWVAGYSEADWTSDYTWGDLVVGKWNGTAVDWVAVDGVPTDPPPDEKLYDKNGFRGGQTEPGDDVGLWTSIAIDGAGNPAVAYYDRTNKALKFAHFDGTSWTIEAVERNAGSDIGRYAKLSYVGSTAVIAYLVIEPGMSGAVTSKVRVATNTGSSWTFEDAVVDTNTPCRKAYCSSGTECVKETGRCTDTVTGCTPECASGTACVDQGGTPACVDIFDKSRIDSYPDAVGTYIATALDGKGGIGIAYYDRIHGNLGIASKAGGAWTTLIVDGQAADLTDTGDMGIGASLFIDSAGDWHLSYVDGYDETVRYVKVTGGTTVTSPEVADDGLGLGGTAFTDGHHIVGDDSKIVVTPGGEVHITYQDATAGKLRYAVGTPGAEQHTWTVKAVEQPGFAGAFSSEITVDGKVQLVNWWRVGGEVKGDVAIVSPP